MPKSKKPRHKMRPRSMCAAAIHHAALLDSPFVGEVWTEKQKQEIGFGILEPVNALLHGDLRNQNWAQAQNAFELGLLFCSKPEHLENCEEIRTEILDGYRKFLIAVDLHLSSNQFLTGNVEDARRALVTVLDLLYAYRPREVNWHNELLRRRSYGERWREKCIRAAFPHLDLKQVRFHEAPRPTAPTE